MASFNKVIFLGNLTKDPTIIHPENGNPIAKLSIAVNHRYKQGDEMKDEVMFIDIVVFGRSAENCRAYLSKGDAVIVEGRLKQNVWTSDDGHKNSKYEVVAQSVTFMPKRAEGSQEESDGEVPF